MGNGSWQHTFVVAIHDNLANMSKNLTMQSKSSLTPHTNTPKSINLTRMQC